MSMLPFQHRPAQGRPQPDTVSALPGLLEQGSLLQLLPRRGFELVRDGHAERRTAAARCTPDMGNAGIEEDATVGPRHNREDDLTTVVVEQSLAIPSAFPFLHRVVQKREAA